MVYRHRRTWPPAQARRARIEQVRRGAPIRGAREENPGAGLPVPTVATTFEVVAGSGRLCAWKTPREWKGPKGLLFSRRLSLHSQELRKPD
jgi:hypothetical protein